jgi:hypothetical protein
MFKEAAEAHSNAAGTLLLLLRLRMRFNQAIYTWLSV